MIQSATIRSAELPIVGTFASIRANPPSTVSPCTLLGGNQVELGGDQIVVLLINVHKSSMDRLGDAHVFEEHGSQLIWAIKLN